MSLRDFPDLFKHLPQHKPWVITISVISVVMVLAVCGFGTYQLLRYEGQPIGLPTDGPTVQYRDISTRELDPNPLTVADVFPSREIPAADPSWPPYLMIGEPHAADDCSAAADGEVKRALGTNGCSQVVRASFASGDNRYFVTAGILNLPDVQVATALHYEIEGLVESGQGRFLGYISDRNVNQVLYTAPPRLTWKVAGHFLLYTVIVRQDSAELTQEEADYVEWDVLDTYLDKTVIDGWSIVDEPTTDPAASDPAATDPAASTDPSAGTGG